MLRLSRDRDSSANPETAMGPFPFRAENAQTCLEAKPPIDALPDPEVDWGGWAASERRRLHPRNAIIEWLAAHPTPRRDYLRRLARQDVGLAASLSDDSRPAQHLRARLALGLFIDFAHEQGLTAPEMAALLDNPRRDAAEAAHYLLHAAMEDSNQAA